MAKSQAAQGMISRRWSDSGARAKQAELARAQQTRIKVALALLQEKERRDAARRERKEREGKK